MSKVLFCLPRYHTNAIGWVRLLRENGHTVALHVERIGASEDHSICMPHVMALKDGRMISMAGYWQLLRAADPDIVVVRGLTRRSSRIAALCALGQRRKLIVYDQEDPVPPLLSSTWWRRVICRIAGFGRITARIAGDANPSIARAVSLPFAACGPSVRLLEAAKTRIARPTPVPHILMVGKYRERKGHAQLIAALAQLRDVHDFRVTFCGEEVSAQDRAMRQQLQAELVAYGLASRARFKANLDHSAMMALYSQHQIFVLPSRDEPAAVSPIESVWNGCAAIVDQHSGTRHYLPASGRFEFDARDPVSIAAALAPLLTSQQALRAARLECLEYLDVLAGDAAVQAAMQQVGLSEQAKWSGREDSNLRPLPPEDSALPG